MLYVNLFNNYINLLVLNVLALYPTPSVISYATGVISSGGLLSQLRQPRPHHSAFLCQTVFIIYQRFKPSSNRRRQTVEGFI